MYVKSFSAWSATESEAEISSFVPEFRPPGWDPLGSGLAEAFSTALFAGRAPRLQPRTLPRARSTRLRDRGARRRRTSLSGVGLAESARSPSYFA